MSLTRKERLMRTLRGEAVDRPAVSFYEINGSQPVDGVDPFNIYSDPSWRPLVELARHQTDRIVGRGVPLKDAPPAPIEELTTVETHYDETGRRIVVTSVKIGKRTLTSRTRRDPDINTVWTEEHLLKDADDLKAYLEIPFGDFGGELQTDVILKVEEDLDDAGISMIEASDPICCVAPLFDMGEFTVVALTEQKLFRQLLERVAPYFHARTEALAKALPGRLWRICGPEYASPPYLPPDLFKEYVLAYDKPMVDAIQRYGGYARIHSHGNLKEILDSIAATGCSALDPIEPPPQGDVSLAYVREHYGEQLALFGNLEASDIENLATPEFEKKVDTAIAEGTAGEGRGFVLMPSACPYGRKLKDLSFRNYQKMLERIERL